MNPATNENSQEWYTNFVKMYLTDIRRRGRSQNVYFLYAFYLFIVDYA